MIKYKALMSNIHDNVEGGSSFHRNFVNYFFRAKLFINSGFFFAIFVGMN